MDVPVKKLVRLLHPDQPAETRAAAALVLGEVGVRDADVKKELVARLTDEDADVRRQAIRAVGLLQAADGLPVLLERVTHGGPEASAAAESAARLGVKGVKGLQALLHTVAPGVRRYIAAALTNVGTAGAEAAGVAVMIDKDPQIAGGAAAAVIANIPTLPTDRRAALAEELIAVARDKKKPLTGPAELAVVRVLVALRELGTAGVLWDRVLPPTPVEVRAMALQAVGGWVQSPTKDQSAKLFACAAEADFRIAAPALMTLSHLSVSDKQLGDWVKLLTAPDVAARRLAVEKVGDRDTAEVAAGLIEQLRHSDRGLRELARDRLAGLKAGRKAILAALADAATAEEAWPLARAAVSFKGEVAPASRLQLLAAATKYVAAADHRSDPLLFLLREIDPAAVQDHLLEAAVELRKKKKYDAALTLLKVIARDPAVGFAVRFELAVCGLKVSARELAPNARDGDPSLRSFDTLFQQDSELLRKELEKAKFIDPEELFYVGFHFAEMIGRERAFGAEVLRLVVKRSPKGETGKAAKNKLKAVGG